MKCMPKPPAAGPNDTGGRPPAAGAWVPNMPRDALSVAMASASPASAATHVATARVSGLQGHDCAAPDRV